MPEIEHNPNDYDPTSFASIIRRCFANVLHTYPQKEGEDGTVLFQRVHRRMVKLRARLEEVHSSQFKHKARGAAVDVIALEQFGIAALNEINAGKTPEQVVKLSRVKLMELARDARKQN